MRRILFVATITFILASCGDYTSADASGGDSATTNPGTTSSTHDSLTIGSGGTGRIGTDTSKDADTLYRKNDTGRRQ